MHLRELGAMGSDTLEFVIITFLAPCADLVRGSTVVATSGVRCAEVLAGDVQVFAMSVVGELEWVESVFDFLM